MSSKKIKIYQSSSSRATKRLGRELARRIVARGPVARRATVIGLEGELGSGKTTFVQGFFQGLGLRQRAVSPTFILLRRSRIKKTEFNNVFHVDAYRLKNTKELKALGFQPILANPQNVVLIEWADKVKRILPNETIWLKFEHGEQSNKRLVSTNIRKFTKVRKKSI